MILDNNTFEKKLIFVRPHIRLKKEKEEIETEEDEIENDHILILTDEKEKKNIFDHISRLLGKRQYEKRYNKFMKEKQKQRIQKQVKELKKIERQEIKKFPIIIREKGWERLNGKWIKIK